jgi:predicted ATPase
MVAETSTNPDGVAPILASILSLPPDPKDPPTDPDSRRQKRLVLEALVSLFADRSAGRPILFGAEDIQWFDPTTLELFEILFDRLGTWRALMVLTLRAESASPRREGPNLTTIALDRLDRKSTLLIIDGIAGSTNLGPQLRDRIVNRTDGVPLFIEELTRGVLAEPMDATHPADRSIDIPDTIQASLMSRLDQAGSVKEVAQIGAAIGREFPEFLLEAVATVDKADLHITLRQLVAAKLLQKHTTPSGTNYLFRHALIQNAAYESLLHARRKQIHGQIAQALQTYFPDTVETQPEILAQHWERAEAFDMAIQFWRLAGERATLRSATFEAAAHLRQALQLIERVPQSEDRSRLELKLSVQYGGALRATQGPPGTDTGKAFARACELGRRLGDDQFFIPALAGLYGYYLVRSEHRAAAQAARELLAHAERTADRFQLMIGHRALGMVMVHTGRLVDAREHLERSLSLYDESNDGPLAFVYGTDHAQTAASFLSMTLWLLGHPDEATAREVWAETHGKKVNHLYSLVQTAMFRIIVRGLAQDWNAVSELAQQTLDLATRHSFTLAINLSRFYLAAARVLGSGHWSELEDMRRAAETWGSLNYRPLYLSLVAQALSSAARPDEALCVLAEAQSLVETTDERWLEAELYRLKGEFILARDPTRINDALASYRTALAIAARQSARRWELRIGVSLASLLRRCNRIDEARSIVVPILHRFGSALNDADIKSLNDLLKG